MKTKHNLKTECQIIVGNYLISLSISFNLNAIHFISVSDMRKSKQNEVKRPLDVRFLGVEGIWGKLSQIITLSQ